MDKLELDGATVYVGDCIARLKELPAGSVQMCVTSPPYYGLRDYGHDGQIGLEETPEAYIAKMVEVFREVRRVLADDGTLWVNIGDSYNSGASGGLGGSTPGGGQANQARSNRSGARKSNGKIEGLKHKDLIGIPWMLAFALRADGWYLRQEIIWHKPNPMPESVRDRCTKAHEYVFLLSKSDRYYYDADAIREPQKEVSIARAKRADWRKKEGWAEAYHGNPPKGLAKQSERDTSIGANRRSVWSIATRPYKGAHFAVFPPALVEPCILAGTSERGHCPACGARWERHVEKKSHSKPTDERIGRPSHLGKPPQQSGHFWTPPEITDHGFRPTCDCGADPVPDVVLDPFNGSGTTGQVAIEHGRQYVGCELNPEYVELTRARLTAAIEARSALSAEPSPQMDMFGT